MATGLPARTNLTDQERQEVQQKIANTALFKTFLEHQPTIATPPPPKQNASWYSVNWDELLDRRYDDLEGEIEHLWSEHWFWKYCFPFASLGLCIALLLILIGVIR